MYKARNSCNLSISQWHSKTTDLLKEQKDETGKVDECSQGEQNLKIK